MKKLVEFFQEESGAFSSARLFSFIVIVCVVIDWMHAVFTTGIWRPEWNTVTLVLVVLGFKSYQKHIELKAAKDE